MEEARYRAETQEFLARATVAVHVGNSRRRRSDVVSLSTEVQLVPPISGKVCLRLAYGGSCSAQRCQRDVRVHEPRTEGEAPEDRDSGELIRAYELRPRLRDHQVITRGLELWRPVYRSFRASPAGQLATS
jgi:hypothetical protein